MYFLCFLLDEDKWKNGENVNVFPSQDENAIVFPR